MTPFIFSSFFVLFVSTAMAFTVGTQTTTITTSARSAIGIQSSAATLTTMFSRKNNSNEEAAGVESAGQYSRSRFLSWSAAAFLATNIPTTAALAKGEVDPSVKGTKKDPEFEICLSQAMYECTKAKGVEQKTRKECLPICRTKCATSEAQLMLGTPIKN